MLIRKGSLPIVDVQGSAPRKEERIADAAGLTGLGANICHLPPGACSAKRHWHSGRDEFLYMIAGQAVLIEDDGEHAIGPGDICCWPAGVENAHMIENRNDAPVRYLVVDHLAPTETVRYPDDRQTLYSTPDGWRMVADDGTVLDSGTD